MFNHRVYGKDGKQRMKTFNLNGKIYSSKSFGFNFMCSLEKAKLPLDEIEKNPMRIIRLYISYCMGTDEETAGNEIEAHVENGGDLAEIADIMSEAMDESGFFRAISKGTKKKNTTSKSKSEKVVAITEA